MTSTQNHSSVSAAVVKISGPDNQNLYQDKKISFQDLPESWKETFEKEGKLKPTPIQEMSFHPIVDGHDLLAQSMTGSGKTLAFSLPIAHRFSSIKKLKPRCPKILILTPTRELADQITQVFQKTLRQSQVRVTSVIGGVSYTRQEKALQNSVHVVIGTPGRVSDLIKKKTLLPDEIETFVLDEVDQMLDTGFEVELKFIRQNIPDKCQTLFFSATLNHQARRLASKFLTNPVSITSSENKNSPESIEHGYIATKSHLKTKALIGSLAFYNPEQAIIFCETKKECSDVTHALMLKGFSATQLNSDLNQYERQMAISQFKNGTIRFLVATNVAARGIDVQGLPMVINYTPPKCAESYTHRAGRTGRAGAKGKAWTFITPEDCRWYSSVIRQVRAKAEKVTFPDSHSFMETLINKEIAQISAEVAFSKNFSADEMSQIDQELAKLTPEQHKALVRQIIASRVSKIGVFDPAKLQWTDFDLKKNMNSQRSRHGRFGSSGSSFRGGRGGRRHGGGSYRDRDGGGKPYRERRRFYGNQGGSSKSSGGARSQG